VFGPLTREFALFTAVAALGGVVQLAVLAVLTGVGVRSIPAFWAGWLAGWTHNFVWHRLVVFHSRESRALRHGGRSLVSALAGLAIQTGVFAALATALPVLVAGSTAVALSLPITYLVMSRWAYTGEQRRA
jgi:putative flippase GtrA